MNFKIFTETGLYNVAVSNEEYLKGLEEVCLEDTIELIRVLEYQYNMYLLHLETLQRDPTVKYTLDDLSDCMNTILVLGEHIFGAAQAIERFLDKQDYEFTAIY